VNRGGVTWPLCNSIPLPGRNSITVGSSRVSKVGPHDGGFLPRIGIRTRTATGMGIFRPNLVSCSELIGLPRREKHFAFTRGVIANPLSFSFLPRYDDFWGPDPRGEVDCAGKPQRPQPRRRFGLGGSRG